MHSSTNLLSLCSTLALLVGGCVPASVTTTGTPDDRPPAARATPNEGEGAVSDILGLSIDFLGVRPPAEAAGLSENQQRAILLEGGVRRVALNLVWAGWEPQAPSEAECPPGREAFDVGDGTTACYQIDRAVDRTVQAYRDHGIRFTGVVYGTPSWARRPCPLETSDPDTDRGVFCGTRAEHAGDYGRFGRFLAQRYPEIDTFVVHNEVNARSWYWGTDADSVEAQVEAYARDFEALYHGVRAVRPEAGVCVPLEHHFFAHAARPASGAGTVWAGSDFLSVLDATLAGLEWDLAMHAYPPRLGRDFTAVDHLDGAGADPGVVSYGSLGSVVGWLAQQEWRRPSVPAVHLTENGIDQLVDEGRARHLGQAPDRDGELQAAAMCDAYRNVLATPGIASHVYHRLLDLRTATNEPAEGPHRFGLFRYEVTDYVPEAEGFRVTASHLEPKPAWGVFRRMHRAESLDCGFEHARRDLTRLARYALGNAHWVSSRLPPAGAVLEREWFLRRTPVEGTRPLYACHRAGASRTFVTLEPDCEGQTPEGPVGSSFERAGDGRVELFRCGVGCATQDGASCADEIVTTDPDCEGHLRLEGLGFALASPDSVPAPAPDCSAVRRLSGVNRFETAAAISREVFPGPVERVILVNGDDNGQPGILRPDAVVAGPHAAAHEAPILYLRHDGSAPPATQNELARLRPTRIDLVGGVAAIPASVETQLASDGYEVERIDGRRFLCAVQAWEGGSFAQPEPGAWQGCAVDPAIAETYGGSRFSTAAGLTFRSFGPSRPRLEHGTVTLVSGADERLVDALAASPAAARAGFPMLLTTENEEGHALGATTRLALEILAANTLRQAEVDGATPPPLTAVLVGAVGADPDVAAELEALGYEPYVVYGSGRVETAIAVLVAFPDADGGRIFRDVTTASVAGAGVSADALAASMLQYPLLLTGADRLGEVNRPLSTTFSEAVIVGGEAVVGPGVYTELKELLCGF